MVGLFWSYDPEGYAGSSVATGRSLRTRQVKGDDPDKKRYPGPPGWGLGVTIFAPPKARYFYETVNKQRRPRPIQSCIADDDDDMWLRSAGLVAVMGKTRNEYRSLAENLLRNVQYQDRERVENVGFRNVGCKDGDTGEIFPGSCPLAGFDIGVAEG